MRLLVVLAACWLLAGASPARAGVAGAGAGAAAPCCGAITPDGRRLQEVLDASGVRHLWLPGRRVDWRSGEPDARHPEARARSTHCSAFAAAMAVRLRVPLLHPPQHAQILLANAQLHWLATSGRALGWREVDMAQAQALANRGWLVLAGYAAPNPRRPGHIVLLRPGLEPLAVLLTQGPQEAQAGARNHLRTSVAQGFREHPGAWLPGGRGAIRYYAHRVDWTRRARP